MATVAHLHLKAALAGENSKVLIVLLRAVVVLLRERRFFLVESFLAKCFRQLLPQCLHEFLHHLFQTFASSGFEINRPRRVGLLEIMNVDPIAGCSAGGYPFSDPAAQCL